LSERYKRCARHTLVQKTPGLAFAAGLDPFDVGAFVWDIEMLPEPMFSILNSAASKGLAEEQSPESCVAKLTPTGATGAKATL
jgi:hypothetical protein